jgi:hypothetical protein
MRRYDDRILFRNDEEIFEKLFRDRGVPLIRHYESPVMGHPTPREHAEIESRTHIWRLGDRFFKLAHRYYGDSTLWWLIAWFNKKPTEGHLKVGDSVNIPLNLENALMAFTRRRKGF